MLRIPCSPYLLGDKILMKYLQTMYRTLFSSNKTYRLIMEDFLCLSTVGIYSFRHANSVFFVLIMLLCGLSQSAGVELSKLPRENGVVVLETTNFDTVLRSAFHHFNAEEHSTGIPSIWLVVFFTRWSPSSLSFEPNLAVRCYLKPPKGYY